MNTYWENNKLFRYRLFHGVGAQGFSQAVQLAIRLAEVALFLSLWGPVLYGEWLMVGAIPAFLVIADGGYSSAACREMCMRNAAGDRIGVLSVFQSTWALLLSITLVVAMVGVLVAHTPFVNHGFGLELLSPGDLKWVICLLTGHVMVTFLGALLLGGFWCSGHYPQAMFLSAITQLFEFAGLAVALVLNGEPAVVAAGFLAGRLVGTVLMWLGLKRVNPWIKCSFMHVTTKELKRLFMPAIASMAFPLGNAFNIQGLRLVVGFALGPAAVAVFTALRTASRLALQPRVIVAQIVEPELALAFGAGDTKRFGVLFSSSCQIALWASIAATLVLAAVSEWLFPFWTDGKMVIIWPLYGLLLSAVIVNSLWHTALMVAYATNRHATIAAVYVGLYGMATFALAYAGATFFGLFGTGAVLLIAELAMLGSVVSMAIKLSRQGFRAWLGTVLRPPLFLIPHALEIMRRLRLIRSN